MDRYLLDYCFDCYIVCCVLYGTFALHQSLVGCSYKLLSIHSTLQIYVCNILFEKEQERRKKKREDEITFIRFGKDINPILYFAVEFIYTLHTHDLIMYLIHFISRRNKKKVTDGYAPLISRVLLLLYIRKVYIFLCTVYSPLCCPFKRNSAI